MKLREKQKAEVKSSLIHAGEDLFREKGFAETTVEEIAGKAGVARGTFYNYFQTKEELVLELLYEEEEFTTEQIEEFFSTISGPVQQIQVILTKSVEWTLKRPELFLVAMIEKMKHGRTPEHPEGPLSRRMMTEAFRRGQIAGSVTKEREPQELSHDLEGLQMIHFLRWYHYGQQSDLLSELLSAVNTYLTGALIKEL